MGTSFTEFRGRGFWSHDSGLEIWLYLLAREMRLHTVEAWAHSVADAWETQATAGFNGCVSANLDRLCDSAEKVEYVISVSIRAGAAIREQAPRWPADLLNSFGLGGPGSYFVGDVETEYVERVGAAFVGLLRGTLDCPDERLPSIDARVPGG